MTVPTKRSRHTRLCHLVASMRLEEEVPKARKIPSAFTLLKAEFGYTGTRAQVWLAAMHDAKEGI